MSASTIANPPTRSDSKSAKKKKAKSTTTPSKALSIASTNHAAEAATNGHSDGYENPYLKELHKGIRNVNKKLNATQKVDSIIAENPGKSLDDLVASRKINTDQKTQALKKPALQAQLTQLEEQLAQCQKVDQDYQNILKEQKEALEVSHKTELEKAREATLAEVKTEAERILKDDLLTLSKFLRAAAARRHQLASEEGAVPTEEDKAFEGALLLVYGGNASAVEAMQAVINGAEEKVPATEAEEILEVTYAQVKQTSLAYVPPYASEEAWAEDVAQAETEPVRVAEEIPAAVSAPEAAITDPTIANATLTEINSSADNSMNNTSDIPQTESPATTVPEQSTVAPGTGNEAVETTWSATETPTDAAMTSSWEHVEVPRDPAETENGWNATPAASSGAGASQSWAEEVHEATTNGDGVNGNDGFHEVHHRGKPRGAGGFQAENRRGRGGHRGDFRSRGRGGGRGRGGYRGNRGKTDAPIAA
ncbi:MAG: hypothetical protein M1834_001784 [Cirrosporium novae-zelandiae]|nr:MAG: hypothetical protein M1834_001784 [Cirrosporium novae-zelandiae]